MGKRKQYFQILETTKTSISRWKVKLPVVHSYYGILVGNKEGQSTDTGNNLDGSPKHYTEWKERQFQKVILCDSFHITFLKWQNHRNGKLIGGFQALWRLEPVGRDVTYKRIALERSLWWWNHAGIEEKVLIQIFTFDSILNYFVFYCLVSEWVSKLTFFLMYVAF